MLSAAQHKLELYKYAVFLRKEFPDTKFSCVRSQISELVQKLLYE